MQAGRFSIVGRLMMPTVNNWIAQALTPGVALTAIIFYNTSLQNRFVYITGRVRDLNREARQLREQDPIRNRDRIRSLRWQVRTMMQRSRIVRRAVLTVYCGFVSFIATILLLAAGTWFSSSFLARAPAVTFALGFLALLVAAMLSTSEMYLGQRSINEDVRTSYDGEDEASGPKG